KQSKIMRAWHFEKNGHKWRVVLGKEVALWEHSLIDMLLAEKDTLDVWVNGQKRETRHEFVDEGTEIAFHLDDISQASIKTVSSGNKKQGMVYVLEVDNAKVEECDQ